MKKIDEEAVRASVIAAWSGLSIDEAGLSPDGLDRARALVRAARFAAELAVFGIAEMERYKDEPLRGIQNVGFALGTALHNITEGIGGTSPDGEDGAHVAIHEMLDMVSKVMHDLHYRKHEGDPSYKEDTLSTVEIVRKEVGDA